MIRLHKNYRITVKHDKLLFTNFLYLQVLLFKKSSLGYTCQTYINLSKKFNS